MTTNCRMAKQWGVKKDEPDLREKQRRLESKRLKGPQRQRINDQKIEKNTDYTQRR